ncbi:MAG: hypothetical protein MUP40_03005, partial [Actinobacteria bacterium]|nr:hypothetical protein [Actinomycetota bacterium]
GSYALDVLSLVDEDGTLADRLSPDIPYIKAQVRFAVEGEMAKTLDDFMVRRTEIFYYTPDQGLSAAPDVANMMGDLLGWDEAERKRQVDGYKKTVELSRLYAR